MATYFQLLVDHQPFVGNQLLFPAQSIQSTQLCETSTEERWGDIKPSITKHQKKLPQVVEYLLWRMNQMFSGNGNQCQDLSEIKQKIF